MASILNRSLLLKSLHTSYVYIRSVSSTQQHRPLMLMDIPHVVYPNMFLIIKNFFSRMIINGYFDSTFAIKPFTDGAKQAVTVVSQLIANEQFDDLPGFVTREVNKFKKKRMINNKIKYII